MKAVTISLKTSSDNRYEIFLKLVSGLLIPKLTEREIEVLVACKSLAGGNLGTDSRRLIKDDLGISEYTLNNYIKQLRDKKVVAGNEILKTLNIDTGTAADKLVIHFNIVN